MWGSFFGLLLLPLALLLLLMAIAFGTAALLFPAVIGAVIGVIMLFVYGARRGDARVSHPGEPGGADRPSGAPVAGEGSGSPLSATGKAPE
jgi:hypothetical protein